MDHEKILRFLSELRAANPVLVDIYLFGSCLNLYCLLRVVWSSAACYYSQHEGHVITRIGGRFYDITGEVADVSTYDPIETIWATKYKSPEEYPRGDMYVAENKAEYMRKPLRLL